MFFNMFIPTSLHLEGLEMPFSRAQCHLFISIISNILFMTQILEPFQTAAAGFQFTVCVDDWLKWQIMGKKDLQQCVAFLVFNKVE